MVTNALSTTTTSTPTLHALLPDLVRSWLAGKSPRTVAAYQSDLAHFASFVGAATPAEALHHLLGRGPVEGSMVARRWAGAMVEAGLSPASINRRMAAIRSLSALARIVTGWALEVPSIRSTPYRDTRGPGPEVVRSLLAFANRQPDPRKAARDAALVHLLHDLALRRAEVVALDLDDLDPSTSTLKVSGKGRRGEKEVVTVPPPTLRALSRWIGHRGTAAGPLLLNLDRRTAGARLTGGGVYAILARLGEGVGVEVRPHALRHCAITSALDATGGDVRRVQRFARHRDVKVTLRYDDNRADLAGAVAALVALTSLGETVSMNAMNPKEAVA
jgi:integrase/recombinase XerC